MRDLKASNAVMILGMIGKLVKATCRGDERFAGLKARIERSETRLDLSDTPDLLVTTALSLTQPQ